MKMAARSSDDHTVSTQEERQDDKHREVDSSDEDKPLIIVREKIRKENDILEDLTDIGNLWDSSWESDDSAKDPTFKVNKKELNKSDSSDNENDKAVKRKKYKKKFSAANNNQANTTDSDKVKSKKYLYKKGKSFRKNRNTHGLPSMEKNQQRKQNKNKRLYSRDRNWKRKLSNFNRKLFIQGRPKTPNSSRKFKISASNSESKSLLQAKRISKGVFQVRECLNNLHLRTLDALLYSNGLKRKEIEGDGNCFFTALKESSGLQDDLLTIRKKICNHIKENRDDYIGFLKKNENSCEETIKDSFNKQLDTLRQSGSWSVDLSDVLPLAVANYTKREITIYTSKRSNPVISVKPTVHFDQHHGPPIFLAYVATPGFEHYDSCKALGVEHDQQEEGKENNLRTQEDTINKTQFRNTSSEKRDESDMNNAMTPKKSPKRKNINISPAITPRKQAKFQSPKKRNSVRKRKANPCTWKKNIRKNLRLTGQEYTNVAGKKVNARKVQQSSCSKCRFKCTRNVSEEQRQSIFDSYWNLNSKERQMDYICSHVEERNPDRIKQTAKRPRNVARMFYLPLPNGNIRVCKTFFSRTLNIGEKTISTALKYKKGGIYTPVQQKRIPHNATPSYIIDAVKAHIESFPVLDAHYTRKDTNRKFLGQELNITKMYNLYKDECQKQGVKAAGSMTYRRIFCNHYNFSFHVPKKDQCQTCVLFDQAKQTGSVTTEMQHEYDNHIERKERAREEKSNDKIRSKENKKFHACTFDLEAVLPIPCSLVSQVYYKRKLSCYNLSVYSLGDSKASCFLWNETEGNRGSCEIGTCLLLYLKSLPSNIDHVCFFSDSCTGQNRNRFIATALVNAVATLPYIQTVDHKFLESGHTQMECDSMHAAIETAKKRTSVFVPSQWDTIVRMARRKSPYTVVPLKHYDILNFKPIAEKIIPQSAVDEDGKRVMWMKICWMQYNKAAENFIYFKYKFDETFHTIRLKSGRSGKSSVKGAIPYCYQSKLPISRQKKADLISLCKSNIIPEEFHGYYELLPTSNSREDRIPDPDILESDYDSDAE